MIEQKFYHYEKWEDYQSGMYDELKEGRTSRIELAQLLLKNEKLCEKWMREVTKRWKVACEQNFTNPQINRKAWLGQAACCLYAGVKENETREAWWLLTEEQRNIANNIAEIVIKDWEYECLQSGCQPYLFNLQRV